MVASSAGAADSVTPYLLEGLGFASSMMEDRLGGLANH